MSFSRVASPRCRCFACVERSTCRYAGALSTAILWAEAAVQKDRARAHGWEILGLYQAENEQEVQAITALQACVRADPARSSAHLALAVSYTNEMRFVETWVINFAMSLDHFAGLTVSVP